MTTTRTPVAVRRLIIVLGAVYLTSQLVLFSIRRPPSWDEVIYLSQVTPGLRAMMFVASRSRGITLLVAPVTIAGGSLTVVRVVLAIISSAALVVALLTWIPSIGIATPIAGSFFALSWLALLYGSEVMPNLWSAISGLAATGVFVRLLTEPDRPQPILAWALVGSMALMALVRPPDALVLTLSLAAYVLLFQRRAARRLTILAAGLLLGWIPWLLEMSVRFGGPIEAFQQAVRVGHIERTGLGRTALQQLALTNGPTLGFGGAREVRVLWRTRTRCRVPAARLRSRSAVLPAGLRPVGCPCRGRSSGPHQGSESLWTGHRMGCRRARSVLACVAGWHRPADGQRRLGRTGGTVARWRRAAAPGRGR